MAHTNIKKSVLIDGKSIGESVELSVCAENVSEDGYERILREMKKFENRVEEILEGRAESSERDGADN